MPPPVLRGCITYSALTPAAAGVGRCHKNFRQVSGSLVEAHGNSHTHTHTHTHTQHRSGRCRQVSGNAVEAHGNSHTQTHTHTHTHFVTVIRRTQPTVDRRQAGTDQNDSSRHNHKIVMEARRLSERDRDRRHCFSSTVHMESLYTHTHTQHRSGGCRQVSRAVLAGAGGCHK